MGNIATPQSIIDYRETKEAKQSIIDNRVKGLHSRLVIQLKDESYGIGHTYMIAKKFSDYDIVTAAEYCARKARTPAAAFIALFSKKMSK